MINLFFNRTRRSRIVAESDNDEKNQKIAAIISALRDAAMSTGDESFAAHEVCAQNYESARNNEEDIIVFDL